MSEFEQQLLDKIDSLEQRLARLENTGLSDLSEARKREIENGNLELICDIPAIAYLWGCSPETVKGGRAGTRDIKRIPGSRIRATKREVLAAINRRDKPAAEIAAEYRQAQQLRKKRSFQRSTN